MRFPEALVRGRLIRRYKRFIADVELEDGRVVTVHVPNTGSMSSSSAPGSPVGISRQDRPERKLKWTLEIVRADGAWVGVHTGRTNRIVEEAVLAGRIPSLRGYPTLRREVRFGERSRVDILLERGDEKIFVEVKNVTYKVGSKALFPDAVTERGARHLRELARMVEQGHRAMIFYLINRDDCTSMGPAREIDPAYGRALDEAKAAGVEALAYRARNTFEGAVVERKIPISG